MQRIQKKIKNAVLQNGLGVQRGVIFEKPNKQYAPSLFFSIENIKNKELQPDFWVVGVPRFLPNDVWTRGLSGFLKRVKELKQEEPIFFGLFKRLNDCASPFLYPKKDGHPVPHALQDEADARVSQSRKDAWLLSHTLQDEADEGVCSLAKKWHTLRHAPQSDTDGLLSQPQKDGSPFRIAFWREISNGYRFLKIQSRSIQSHNNTHPPLRRKEDIFFLAQCGFKSALFNHERIKRGDFLLEGKKHSSRMASLCQGRKIFMSLQKEEENHAGLYSRKDRENLKPFTLFCCVFLKSAYRNLSSYAFFVCFFTFLFLNGQAKNFQNLIQKSKTLENFLHPNFLNLFFHKVKTQ